MNNTQPSEMRFIHYRPNLRLGYNSGLCVGYVIGPGGTAATLSVHVMRYCYNKKVGRMVCKGKYAKGKMIDTEIQPDAIENSVLNAAIKFVQNRY
jgi:hypothetical protein